MLPADRPGDGRGTDMSAVYYYLKNGQQCGPVSAQELKALADAGQLLPTDKIWKKGAFEDRRRAAEFPGLFPNGPSAAAGPPPAAAAAPGGPTVEPVPVQAAVPRREGTPEGPCNFCHQHKPGMDIRYLQLIALQFSKGRALIGLVGGFIGLGPDAWRKETQVLQCRCCQSCYRKGRRVGSARWQVPLLTFLGAVLVLAAGLSLAWVTTPPVAPGEDLPWAMGVKVLLSWAFFVVVLLLYPFFLGRLTRRRIKALLDPATEEQLKAMIGTQEWSWRRYLILLPERPEGEVAEPFERVLEQH